MFLLIIEQRGAGCDYTVGCGTAVLPLKSTRMEDAVMEAKMYIWAPDGEEERQYFVDPSSEFLLENATVVEVVGEIDIELLTASYVARVEAKEAAKEEAAERAAWEHLKAKFNKEKR